MGVLNLIKTSDKDQVVVGDRLMYSLVASNTTDVPLHNVVIYDLLVGELVFVKGSVVLDDVNQPKMNILSGIQLGTIQPGETHKITFLADVVEKNTGTIVNQGKAQFSYESVGGIVQQTTVMSNEYSIQVYDVEIVLTKQVDQKNIYLEDRLVYTITLENTGDLDVFKVKFKDALPEQLELVQGSFKIDGKTVNSVNLEDGIIVGDIASGKQLVINYQADVRDSNCEGILTNEARAYYSYQLPDGQGGEGEAVGKLSTDTFLKMSTFKQMNIERYLQIPEVKPNIESINSVTAHVTHVHCHVIDTPKMLSTEGQHLTGYKLIVRGEVHLVIEYTALEEEQSVHSAYYTIPFSTFIILPKTYKIGSKIEIEGIVEGVHYTTIDIRTFFVNVLALIHAKILG